MADYSNSDLGQLRYYQTSLNGKDVYQAVPWGGNAPSGYNPITADQYKTGLQQSIADYSKYNIDTPEVHSVYQSGLSKLQEQLNGFTSQSGIYAPTYRDTTVNIPGYANGVNPNFASGFQAVTPEQQAAAARTQIINPKPTAVAADFVKPLTTGIPTTGVTSPTLPTPTATNNAATYFTGLTQSVQLAQNNLDAARQQQLQQIQQDKQTAQTNFDSANASQNTAIQAEQKAKLDQLSLEEQRFNDNYNTVQGLIGQLQDMTTKGNLLIEQQKGVTGLAAIRNPRIDQTVNSITAATGVIKAAIDGYNGQMSAARAQLIDTTNVLTSAYKDQIDYYSALADFYGKGVVTATKAQEDFIQQSVDLAKAKLDQAQANSDYIQKLLVDPQTALQMARAGINLNMTPEEVNAALAADAQRQDVIDTTNTYVKAGWIPSAIQTTGTVPIQVGGQTLYFKPPAKEVSAGASLIDPVTGKVLSTAPASISSTGGNGTYVAGADPIVDSWIRNVLSGNSTMQQVPSGYRNAVSVGLTQQPTTSYSPLAISRFTMGANRIVANFIDLPQYQLTANGLPYLQRIDAAMKTPGSVSDQDLLDSLTKLNTAGNAISDAQVKIITDGKSFADMASSFMNKFKNGGVLSDNQRQQIQTIAQSIYANYQKGYQPVYDQVTSQLIEAGIPKAFWTIPDLNSLSAQATGGGSFEQSPAPTGNDLWNF